MHPAYVKVRVVCDRCHAALDLCVRVARNVPTPIACSPGGSFGGGGNGSSTDLSCGMCGLCWRITMAELLDMVNHATRRGWGEHVLNGAVEIHCPAA